MRTLRSFVGAHGLVGDVACRRRGALQRLRVVCLEQPSPFESVGQHYIDFEQVGDDEVVAALDSTRP